jgi:hypothetical protein
VKSRLAITFIALTAISWFLLSLVASQRAVRINVRWKPGIENAQRAELERRLHLRPTGFDGGSTWHYILDDPSTDNIRSLVHDGAVDDTAYLDRDRFRPEGERAAAARRPTYALAIGLIGALALFFVRTGVREPAPLQEHPTRWLYVLLALTAPLLVALGHAMWRTPYPINETVGILEDVRVQGLSFFNPSLRSYYRPLYFVTWYLLWNGTGSLDIALAIFRLISIAAAGGLVVIFVLYLHPRTILDCAAGAVAVAVLIGIPGFRANLELPLSYTLMGMPIIFVIWILLEREPRAWHAPTIAALTVLAIGFKEQGLVIVPLVAACWYVGSPGATTRTTAWVVAIGMIYLAMRLATSGHWAPFEQAVGYGFRTLQPEEAVKYFGGSLWRIRAYNVAATVANQLFAEPIDGQFVILGNFLTDSLRPWQVIQVLSSTALTGIIAWWGVAAIRRDRRRPWSFESRVCVAVVTTILASGALGFNYTRDRMAGMAVMFVALAAYLALRRIGARTMRLRGTALAAACCALILFAGAWQLRALGAVEQIRWQAQESRRHWLVDVPSLRQRFGYRPVYLDILAALTAQGIDPSAARPASYPGWLRVLIWD